MSKHKHAEMHEQAIADGMAQQEAIAAEMKAAPVQDEGEYAAQVDPQLSIAEKKNKLVADIQQTLSKEKEAFGIAAAAFEMYVPIFRGKLNSLTHADCLRVIMGLIEVPFSKKDYSPLTPIEKETFLIGQTLLECKTMMFIDALQQDEIKKMEEMNITSVDKSSELADNKKEESNG